MPLAKHLKLYSLMKTLNQSQIDESIIDWPVHMERALVLAQTVLTTTPNPRVGCVLVKSGEVVGEGWHEAAGKGHAEVMALASAGDDAKGATAFVSLEPCAHHGRTGPCCDALIKAGVVQVVIASLDPNPQVAGEGISRMEQSGIEVFQLLDYDERARTINPGYFKRRETGLPFVRLKLAMSLDGRTALANGESKWITGPEARTDVQRLRACSSAIVTGISTVLTDDPALTVRDDELLQLPKPMRVILDSQLRTPGTARIVTEPGLVKIVTTVANTDSAAYPENVEVLTLAASDQGVELLSVLESLARDLECNEILVEAGATLCGEFIRLGLVDELVVYVAPKIIGSDGKALLNLFGLGSLDESFSFSIADITRVGEDVRLTLRPASAVVE